MKNKWFIAFLCLFAMNNCIAQFEPGKKMIGGSFSFTTNKDQLNTTPSSGVTNTNFSLSPTFSKFITPTLVSGFGISYGYAYSSEKVTVTTQTTNSHYAGIFYNRIKLQPLGKRIYLAFTGRANILYSYGKHQTSTAANYTTQHNYGISLTGAIGTWYQLNDRFILTGDFTNLLTVGYTNSTNRAHTGTTEIRSTGNSFGVSTGLNGITLNSFAIGVRYLLKK